MKTIIKNIIILFFTPLICLGQEGSIKIYNDSLANNSSLLLPGLHHTYTLENLKCYGFIFDTLGNIWYRDYCPNDYMDIANFGTYSLHKDTIRINSSNTTTAERIHRKSIKEISHTRIEKDTFIIKAFNISGDEEGKIFSIDYQNSKKPRWGKDKYLRLQKPIDWSKLPDEIFVKRIWVSDLKNQSQQSGIWFHVNEKWHIKNNNVSVTFFGESLKIVKENENIFLYKWDRIKLDYEKFDKLIYDH